MSEFVVNRPGRLPNLLFPLQANRQCIALVVALAVVLSATGACDTDNLDIVHRTSLWLVICGLVVSQAVALRACLAPHISDTRLLGAVAVAATVVLTTVEMHYLKYTPFLPKEPDPPLAFLLFIFPLAAPVAMLALIFSNKEPVTAKNSRLVPERRTPAVDASLDAWPMSEVLRVTAQDHYLSVYTLQGTVLIRGRMKDALAQLADANGLQIHRSHWVADSEIARATRQGRDYRVHLSDGTSLPVSRARVAALKQRVNALSNLSS